MNNIYEKVTDANPTEVSRIYQSHSGDTIAVLLKPRSVVKEDTYQHYADLISCADFGDQGDVAVIHCHGGPGSRFEAGWISESANAAGLRLIGISRPGYGGSQSSRGVALQTRPTMP